MGLFNFHNKNKSEIIKLSNLIFETSLECTEKLKNYFSESTEIRSEERWIYILFEFLYFFLHMTNRIAFGKLGNKVSVKLQEKLVPMVIEATINTIFKNFPNRFKKGIKNDFYDKLNNAEIEYSKCNMLLSKDHPLTSDKALFSKLARNVAEISGNSDNPAMLMRIITLSFDTWKKMKLDELIVSVGREL